jgi:ectoine hydroxylase-related dioxygenase (phytanoyl-CoA dioxygenase family)
MLYHAPMIDEQDIEAFERDGVIAVRGLLTDWVGLLRDAIPELLETSYDPIKKRGYSSDIVIRANDSMWRKCEAFGRFLFQSPLGEVAAAVTRSSRAQVYEDLLLYREANGPGEVSWHRDAPHWPLTGNQLSSIWFSLEDVSSETGAMRFVAGSHRDGDELVGVTERSAAETNSFEGRPVIVVEAEPGDVTVFHPRSIHTAYGSSPDQPRRSFTIRLTGDDVRFRPLPSMYHAWMHECGLKEGDRLDHPWFPVVTRSSAA